MVCKGRFIPTISALGITVSTNMCAQYSPVAIESALRPTQLSMDLAKSTC